MKMQRYDGDKDRQPMSLRDAMNRLLNESFWDPFGTFQDSLLPSSFNPPMPGMDVSENNQNFTIELNIAGYEPDQIKIEANQNVLTIYGKASQEKEEKDKVYHRRERSSGEFRRQISLPQNADMKKTSCKAKNGILTITIPKKNNGEEKKLIPIES